MNKMRILLLLCVSSFLLGGCDFVRVIAGRPTSNYIEAKRALIARQQLLDKIAVEAEEPQEVPQEEAREEVRKEVENQEYKALEEELSSQRKLITTETVTKVKKENLSRRYYVVIGSFSQEPNARALAQKAASEGYEAVLLPYYNGFNAVALNPCDDLVEANKVLTEAKKHSFCPADAWILEVKR